MIGIPAFLHIVLVWIPALSTVALSFTAWDNLTPLTEIQLVGFQNYWEIFTIFDSRLFPALFNNFVLVGFLFVCSAIGVFFAYLLGQERARHHASTRASTTTRSCCPWPSSGSCGSR